tara:strand:- start:282 stop:665 length:384 start_codon:yes stop_codon:yes gene_type:complete
MQSEEVIARLENPPVIKNKKPIDLGDMPEDMDLELVKVAIFEIVESVLESFEDDDIHKTSVRHNIANAVWKKIVNEGFSERLIPSAHEMGTDELAILEMQELDELEKIVEEDTNVSIRGSSNNDKDK